MPVPAPSAPRGQRGLRLLGERTKTHIRDEQRDLQDQGLLGVGADHQLRADLDVVEQRLGSSSSGWRTGRPGSGCRPSEEASGAVHPSPPCHRGDPCVPTHARPSRESAAPSAPQGLVQPAAPSPVRRPRVTARSWRSSLGEASRAFRRNTERRGCACTYRARHHQIPLPETTRAGTRCRRATRHRRADCENVRRRTRHTRRPS